MTTHHTGDTAGDIDQHSAGEAEPRATGGRHRRPVTRRGVVATGAIATVCAAAIAAGLVVLGASVTTQAARTTAAEPAPPAARPFTVAPAEVPALTRRPVPAAVRALATAPGHVYVPALSITAPWTPAGFSFTTGLQVPADVHTLGLSTQGAQPDSDSGTGTVLLAGHVNYVGQGAGSLQQLSRIRPGAAVVVTDTTGRRSDWVVVSLTAVVKRDLPHSLFTAAGPRRLVLITCGGPLHHGSYLDNIVATAIPAGSSPAVTHAPTPATTTGPQRAATSAQAGGR